LTSNRVVERYWLARNLAHSRNASAYRDLLTLIKDPHPNVVCQAYYALGRQGKRTAIDPIKTQMTRSDHWYTQFYGYRAIRKLGWNQTQSRPIP
jgi:HEAT repeat protein